MDNSFDAAMFAASDDNFNELRIFTLNDPCVKVIKAEPEKEDD